MSQSLQSILALYLLLQGFIFFIAFVENRYKPKMSKFRLIEKDKIKLHKIATEYHDRGLPIPTQILEEPQSKLLAEAKRLEFRLIFEFCLLIIVGTTPAITLIY